MQPLYQFFAHTDTATTKTGAQHAHWKLVEELTLAGSPRAFCYAPGKGYACDNPTLLAAAISAPLLAFDNEPMRALCGPEGYFTDGRTIWVDGPALTQRAIKAGAAKDLDALGKWAEEMFLQASEAAVGLASGPGVVTTSQVKAAAKQTELKKDSGYEHYLGYDLPFNPLELALSASRQIAPLSQPEEDKAPAAPAPNARWEAVRAAANADYAPLLAVQATATQDRGTMYGKTAIFAQLLPLHQDLGNSYAQGGEQAQEAVGKCVEFVNESAPSAPLVALLATSALLRQPPVEYVNFEGERLSGTQSTRTEIAMPTRQAVATAFVKDDACTDMTRSAVIDALSMSIIHSRPHGAHPSVEIERLRLIKDNPMKVISAAVGIWRKYPELISDAGAFKQVVLTNMAALDEKDRYDLCGYLGAPALEHLGLVAPRPDGEKYSAVVERRRITEAVKALGQVSAPRQTPKV